MVEDYCNFFITRIVNDVFIFVPSKAILKRRVICKMLPFIFDSGQDANLDAVFEPENAANPVYIFVCKTK